MRVRFKQEGDAILAGMVMWLVIFLLIFTAVWWAATAHALPISYSFNGILADGGTVTGAFAFDNEAAPIAVNVRGMIGNQVFGLTSSAFTIAPIHRGLPTVQSIVSELCKGNCIFGAPTVTTLTITGLNSTLRLGWDGYFGNFWPLSSDLRTTNPDGSFHSLIGVTSGTLTQLAVPEPGTIVGLLMGLGGIITYLRWP